MGGMTIRPMTDGDRDAVLDLSATTFDGIAIDQQLSERSNTDLSTGWAERFTISLERHLDDSRSRTYLAVEDGGRIVGYVTVVVDTTTEVGEIPYLAVDDDHQDRGIGTRLLTYGMDELRRAGMSHATIETVAANERCREWYPTLGFKEYARQVMYVRELNDQDETTEA